MNLAIVLSAFAAAVNLTICALSAGFARAPGWSHFRYLSLAAGAAGLYALANLTFATPGVDAASVELAGRFNYAVACVYVAAWIGYSRRHAQQVLSRLDRGLVAMLAAMAVLAWVPDLMLDGTEHLSVAGGIAYHQPKPTPVGELYPLVLVVMLLVPLARFVRRARRGERAALAHTAGFAAFYLAGIEEVLVVQGVLAWPYLADLGFVSVVLAVSVDMTVRVVRDADALAALNRDLETQVAARSQELVTARNALIVAERHAALGQLAAGVGHEINNPLAYVAGNLSFVREVFADPHERDEVIEALDDALDGVERIRRIVGDLSVFGRGDEAERAAADVHEVIATAARIAEPHLKFRATVELGAPPETPIRAVIDPGRLTQVLVNLLVNAAHACEEASHTDARPLISLHVEAVEPGWLQVTVEDHGCGIAPDLLERVFEPFFTTKDVDRGTGLGLFVCKGIIERAGGTITIDSEPGRGTRVRLRLPAAAPMAQPVVGRGRAEPPSVGVVPRLLIIDDDPRVGHGLARMLGARDAVVCRSGRDALAELRGGGEFDAVLCDVMMPDMSGASLHAQVAADSPAVARRFVFITGGPTTAAASAFVADIDAPVLPKPVDRAALEAAIRQVSGARDVAANG